MQLPALLPQNYHSYQLVDTDDHLFELLIKQPADLVQFFVYACEDETWTNLHLELVRKMIDYLTLVFFQNKLDRRLAVQASQAIQRHYSNVRELLSKNILIKLDDTNISVNSLMLGGINSLFQDLIRRQCYEKGQFMITFKGIVYDPIFKLIEEYIYTGEVQELWKLEKELLLEIMYRATFFELKELAIECEKVLIRYITHLNAFDILDLSMKESLAYLKEASLDHINNEQKGIKLTSYGIDSLGCIFYDFKEQTLDIFEKVLPKILHVQIAGTLTEEPAFAKIMELRPKLESLDISHTNQYSDYLVSIPANLQILNISACPWLTSANIKKVLTICPRLQALFVGSNSQLTVQGWSELQKLRNLKRLDVSRCLQITNEDLRILLHASLPVTELNIEECRQITEKGFLEIFKVIPRLAVLNVARTQISDEVLSELTTKLHGLHSLNLTRCENLTETGILDAVRQAFDLKSLVLTDCHISQRGLEEITKIRPYLDLTPNPRNKNIN